MELVATVAAVLPQVSGTSAKGAWKKTTVIVKWLDGQYEQTLALDNMRNADAFSALPVGSQMKFYFNVTSRANNDRWFTSATCWKWEPVGGVQPQPQYAQPYQQPVPGGYNIPGQQNSDIPF